MSPWIANLGDGLGVVLEKNDQAQIVFLAFNFRIRRFALISSRSAQRSMIDANLFDMMTPTSASLCILRARKTRANLCIQAPTMNHAKYPIHCCQLICL